MNRSGAKPHPAIVMGRRSDVLAWNTQGHALFAGHLDRGSPDEPGQRPNMAKLVFLDAHTRDLYTDWPTKAKAVVGNLRITAGRYRVRKETDRPW